MFELKVRELVMWKNEIEFQFNLVKNRVKCVVYKSKTTS